jgi:hypothetical protein
MSGRQQINQTRNEPTMPQPNSSPYMMKSININDLPVAQSRRLGINPEIFGPGILSPGNNYAGAAGARSGVLKNAASKIFN